MPQLGAPIVAATRPGLDLALLQQSAARCFDAATQLSCILILWTPPGYDNHGRPYGQFCETAWLTETGAGLSPLTPGLSRDFKAAAWNFHESFGRALEPYCDARRTGAPSSWRVGRELSVWMFEDDDFRADPVEYSRAVGPVAAAAGLHPVFAAKPSSHDLMEAMTRLRTELPEVYQIFL